MRHIRLAFTMVELLVVIAIIGVLIGLLLPATQAMREAARRTRCAANVAEIQLGLLSYHDRWEVYPVGATNVGGGVPHSWLSRLPAEMDQPVVGRLIDRSVPVDAPENADVRAWGWEAVRCPSSIAMANNGSDYAGANRSGVGPLSATGDGVFLVDATVRRADVRDGLSATMFVGEKLPWGDDGGWMAGDRSTLRHGGGVETDPRVHLRTPPAGTVGWFGSMHPGGLNVSTGGGEVGFLSDQIDVDILRRLIDRDDGALPPDLDRSGP